MSLGPSGTHVLARKGDSPRRVDDEETSELMFPANRRTNERPGRGRARSHRLWPALEALESRRLLAFNPIAVTNNANAGMGSLSYAITQVNMGLYNEITFNLGPGVATITPTTPLPAIESQVLIDGYSDPGTSPNSDGSTNNAVIDVQIDGTALAAAGSDLPALQVEALNTTIDGLSITNFLGPAISLQPPAAPTAPGASAIGDDIWGNFLGVSPLGAVEPNQSGVIVDTTNNLIGGTTLGARNAIYGNDLAGVILYGPNGSSGLGNLVEGNWIVDNGGDGVLVLSANNVIGGEISGAGNLIAGNTGDGVDILGPAAVGNIVAANTIGGAENTPFTPNGGQGVLIENAPGNLVGGTTSGSGNVIAGNTGDGVNISNFDSTVFPLPTVPTAVDSPAALLALVDASGDNATGNMVEGNTIGYDDQEPTEFPTPNLDGVFISSGANTVGGLTSLDANYIVGNERNGVTISLDQLDAYDNLAGSLDNAAPINNVVVGNLIGTETGSDNAGNTLDGVLVYDATGNTIGGSATGSANVVSGNNSGVVLDLGSGNTVLGNLIGTASTGTSPLGNATDGITIDDSASNTIGGTTSGSGNVVSGNQGGVDLTGSLSLTTGNVLWGNLIGTDITGTLPIGNAGAGVIVQGDATLNAIGPTTAGIGAGNTIGFNAGAGVQVVSSTTGNSILANSIFGNDQGGIVLYAALQASYGEPQLTSVIPNAADQITEMQGTFDPGANHAGETFLIDFFGNSATDPAGNYEGQNYLGSSTVTTDAAGHATFDVNLPTVVATGTYVTATATSTSAIQYHRVLGGRRSDRRLFSHDCRQLGFRQLERRHHLFEHLSQHQPRGPQRDRISASEQ